MHESKVNRSVLVARAHANPGFPHRGQRALEGRRDAVYEGAPDHVLGGAQRAQPEGPSEGGEVLAQIGCHRASALGHLYFKLRAEQKASLEYAAGIPCIRRPSNGKHNHWRKPRISGVLRFRFESRLL